MPRERTTVVRTRALLQSAGAIVMKTSGGTEPDLVGVYRGFGFAIECKQPGQVPREVQAHRLKKWKKAGAIAFWTDNPPEALIMLQDRVERRLGQAKKGYLPEDLNEPEGLEKAG